MDELVSNILNSSNDDLIISQMVHIIGDFFDTYNPLKKIDSYIAGIIKINPTTPDLLNTREKLIQLLKKKADLILKEKVNSRINTFCIKKVGDVESLNLLLVYSIFYFLDNIHSDRKLTIGLDFEFNNNKIALCQVSFFPLRKFKHIFIFNPQNLNDYQQALLIKTIFTSPMYRIVHGADSLDIPYIFEELFLNDTEKILKFTETMVDTRFLCEYFKIFSKFQDKKCSIYDALLYFKVISKNKYNELLEINKIMGPVQNVHWNITKMSSFHLKYVLYDVLYLKGFVLKIFHLGLEKNSSLRQHLRYIPQIDRFICYEKYGLSNLLINAKQITDPINNFMVELPSGSNTTMITIFNDVIQKTTIAINDLKISNLLEINNFKKAITLLLKKIVYSIITNKYVVYENKNDQFITKITYKDIISQLISLKLDKLAVLLERFYESAKIIIITEI
jgi:hypothetical protein